MYFYLNIILQHIRGGSHLLLETETDLSEAKCDSPSPTVGHNIGNTDSEDVQLVTLDVLSLRNMHPSWRHTSLTPPSSIDLEWESDGKKTKFNIFLTGQYVP